MSKINKKDMYDPLSDNFKRSEFPFYWIAQVNSLYSQEMERLLKKAGIGVPQWRIILILMEHSELSISEISEHAIAKLPTTTKIIYRMCDEGLLDVKTSTQDRRVTLVSLTDKGIGNIKTIRESVKFFFEKSFQGLTSSQINRLNQLLAILYGNLKDFPT